MTATRSLRAALAATLVLALFCGAAPAQGTPDRIALVIGNSRYEGGVWDALNNPGNDAQAMSATLHRLGFRVMGCGRDGPCLDATRAQMAIGIRSFLDALQNRPGSIAFVYYSGHGVQARSQLTGRDDNYLIPVSSGIEKEFELFGKAISMQDVVDQIKGVGVRIGIIALDACRTDHLPRAGKEGVKGLTPNSETGFILAYAAASGETATDGRPGGMSPYARRLSEQLLRPESIMKVFVDTSALVRADTGQHQKPELIIRLDQDLVLANAPVPVTVAAPVPVSDTSAERAQLATARIEDLTRDGLAAAAKGKCGDAAQHLGAAREVVQQAADAHLSLPGVRQMQDLAAASERCLTQQAAVRPPVVHPQDASTSASSGAPAAGVEKPICMLPNKHGVLVDNDNQCYAMKGVPMR